MVSLSRAIDRVIGLFSPEAEFKRAMYRHAVRSKYAAAQGNTNTGSWNPSSQTVNTVIGNSATTLRARARQLVRDMPAMATAINRVEDFVVGDGVTLQARVKDPSTGMLAKVVNQQIEDAWNFWCDEADAGGRLHFYEIQQLAARGELEVGEYLFIQHFTRAANRYLPFDLLAIEPDRLTAYGANTLPGNDLHEGVEYDPRTGKAQAYHFEDADRWRTPQRYPAQQISHGFKTLRPNQLRGVTPLAASILLAHQLRDFLEATMSRAQREARWLAFVTSNDPLATMNALGGALTSDDDNNSYYESEMGHAVVDFLRAGESVTVPNMTTPGDTFDPFTKFTLRIFAASVGVTYELVSGDYTSAQYSSTRVSRNDMLKNIAVRRSRLVRQFCEPVKRQFMFWANATGRLDLPGYMTNQEYYNRCVWMPPGVEYLDPLREGRAETDAVNAKLKSPQEVLHQRGRDPEQVLDEHAEWKQMLEDRGLNTPTEQKPLASNPAAVADQGKVLQITGDLKNVKKT